MTLAVAALEAGYGGSKVLQGVAFAAPRGAVTTIVGRNGMGKTTTLRAIMGIVPPSAGTVTLDGAPIAGRPVHGIARAGVAYVPEGRQIFPKLTVAENLRVGQRRPSALWPQERLFALMPNLAERLANEGRTLSGGEQQMLAIARALVTDPAVLLLDEPSQGLAPMIVRQLAAILLRLRGEGVAIVLVEQNLGLALAVADAVLIMVKGRIVHSSTADEFRADEAALRAQWLTP
ncbi:MAG: ABC transporter ATP-binding protein [Alphaproteobacteria bacterium]